MRSTSGASVYMADFEDASTPSWANMVEGQFNLRDAVRRRITFKDPDSGKDYALGDKLATLLVRPRGWHLPEKHLLVDGQPIAGALFDFGLYFFHNAKALIAAGTGPYFYLPSWRAISRRGCGTTSSSTRRRSSACRKAPSRRPC